MTKNFGYIHRSYKKDDESSLVALLRSSFSGTTFEQWTWKYKLNPNFDPSLVMVAEKDGNPIGFITTTVQNLKISRSIMVKALGSPTEILVHPNHRKRNVGKNLTLKLFKIGKERNFVVSYGIASPEVYQYFWARIVNAVSIPTSTVVYTKLLSCQFLKPWISKISRAAEKDKRLANIDLTILFRLKGIPTFTIRFDKGKISMINRQISTPNVIIEGTSDIIRSLAQGKRLQLFVLLKALLTRNLKARGVLRNTYKLYQCFRALAPNLRSVNIGLDK